MNNMNILQRPEKKPSLPATLSKDTAEGQTPARSFNSQHSCNSPAIEAHRQWPAIPSAYRLHSCGSYWLNRVHEADLHNHLLDKPIMLIPTVAGIDWRTSKPYFKDVGYVTYQEEMT